jgi:hypothetical protein
MKLPKTPLQFVEVMRDARDSAYDVYARSPPTTRAAILIDEAHLTVDQKRKVLQAIDQILYDTYYGFLLHLDGAAKHGGIQQPYTLIDSEGDIISDGNGDLEGFAYEVLLNGERSSNSGPPSK